MLNRTRLSSLDAFGLRDQRNRIYPALEASDGSTLSLDFTQMSSLDSRFTFDRTSTATFINSSGLVQFSNANLMTFSTPRASGSAWQATGTVTWGSATITDPLGNATAQEVTFGTVASAIFNTSGTTVVSGITHTFSVWLRAASGTTNVRIGNANVAPVSTVTLTTTWQRFSCQYVSSGTNDGGAIYSQTGTPSSTCYVWGAQLQPGSTVGELLETTGSLRRNIPRFDYDPTTLTPRGLLMEGSATNFAYSSEGFSTTYWGISGLNGGVPTSTSQTNPQNTASCMQFVEDTTTTTHGAYQIISGLTAGTIYTLSAWVKSDGTRNFASLRLTVSGGSPSYSAVWSLTDGTPGNTLTTGSPTSTSRSIVAYPNGWYRIQISMACPATFTAMLGYVNGSNTNTLTTQPQSYTGTATKGIYVWGAQFEAGSGASSYIPTGASTVQRAADLCEITSGIPSLYNSTTGIGTFFMDVEHSAQQNANGGIELGAGTGNQGSTNRVSCRRDATIFGGTVLNLTPTGGGQRFKTANAFAPSDLASVRNNGSPVTSTTNVTMTGLTALKFYVDTFAGGLQFYGTVRQIKFWPTRLPNATLQSLTA